MFPVVDIDGKLIESKKFLWGLPVMNYLELVAVVGIITSVLDGLLDMSTGLGFPLLQIFETTAYFIVIRTEDQTSSWYVLSMLFVMNEPMNSLQPAIYIVITVAVEEKLPNVQALQNFCDTTATLLVISRVDQKGHVDVSNEISGNKQALFRVIFYKNRPIPLSADGYKTDISVITTHQNATETFLGSIQQVFSKALEPNTNGSKNKQLFGLIHELEENLQTAVGGSTDSAKGITSLEDEINQWLRSAQNNKDPGNYSEALEPLAEQYNAIKNNLDSSFVLDDLFGFVEAAEESVDTLWNAVDHPYPQKRMKQLIEIIGEQLYQFIVARIQPVSELWRSKTSPEALRSSIALVDQWIDAVELLTAKSWPSNPLNEWKGGPMSMEFCVGFQKRLEEIFSLRTLPDQLVGLLRDSSILPQIHSSIESAMRNFNPCVYSLTEADQTQWRTRLNSAEKGIDGLMERAIPELRVRLQPSQADLNGVLEDMYNFRNFLNRKSVMERMQVEREALISRLLEYLQVQRKEYNDYVRNSAHAIGKFLTEIASKIIWIRSHVVQAEKMKRNSEPLLSDLPGYKRLVQALDSHLEELRAAESESFDSWCRDMISHTGDDNDSIALQTAGRLMILERERGLLNVSYSDRLARLLSEVRQLQSLGFQIPTKIMNFVQVGQKYYQYGIVLKQVAHFYNTIEQQMLPCQQSMMLEEALAFERLVLPSAKPNEYSAVNITWDNPERLKAYIEKLKEAAQKLTDHNR
ncbi:cytoplasmic dynein 2 heavy chain 1 [Ditylenchus destructor]|nr:cytoplasmic dynein 2 heavy chain 1 [Ditylenchus destructor]